MKSLFQKYWDQFCDKSHLEREQYFSSLTRQAQQKLVQSFFNDGWHELFIHNIVDEHLDFIKKTYSIDLFDLRIKSLHGRTFLIEKRIWDHIQEILLPYRCYYKMDNIFGGLLISYWGKYKNYVLIKRNINE